MGRGIKLSDEQWDELDRLRLRTSSADVFRNCLIIDTGLQAGELVDFLQRHNLNPVAVVQALAGHADIKTTRKFYLTVRPEDFVLAGKVLQQVMAKTRDN